MLFILFTDNDNDGQVDEDCYERLRPRITIPDIDRGRFIIYI